MVKDKDNKFPSIPENSLELSNTGCKLYFEWFVFEESNEHVRLQPDVSKWCYDTLSGQWRIQYEIVDFGEIESQYHAGKIKITGPRVFIEFENPIDKVAFKLRWL